MNIDMPNKTIDIQFWGVRGTLPVSGQAFLRYGGNTNCVTLKTSDDDWFIFDAGSGIFSLAQHIHKHNLFPFSAKILITHPHWDHINGLPYFSPFYMKGNQFEIISACDDKTTVKELILGQMDRLYFPVTPDEIVADLHFKKINEESMQFGEVQIQTMRLSHPGICLGYRVQYHGKVFCYITDNELFLESSDQFNPSYRQKLMNFIKGCDFLVMDATYTDEQYLQKINWGHSCITEVVKLAHQAQVKLLSLYHHDPSQNDDDIDRKLKNAQNLLKSLNSTTQCIAPADGDMMRL